ncbi:SRPBCC family protein [Halosegnis marinus]|uniref:SRPBCC family protein n=1 Tax=Halosegnis marinus TaxID=3034023 RepID=A0ABD5ZR43_9EURY|nr:SRPBCC family protein [Halosegnis sp. DT85]
MDAVELSTVVYAPREEVFEFLLDFPGYARYSEHLDRVEAFGPGGEGTEYGLTFSWWKLSYTARSRVTEVIDDERIRWELTKDLDAAGYWRVEDADPPESEEHATRVVFRAEFAPDSANSDAISLPSLVSWDWVIDKAKPKIQTEAERVVRRAVRDLEGRARHVDIHIRTTPDAV